jgi:molybdopterin molybdotransferase
VQSGENVRPQGADLRAGETVLRLGHCLRPQDLGLLAMLGKALVPVHRRPRVALFSSGDELLPVDAPLEPGKIHDSNSYVLSALIEKAGAQLIRLGVARDRREAVENLLQEAARSEADLILSSAGVSVGAFDFVKEVVDSNGRLDFWRVNMRPGKPLAFGQYRGTPFIGLPGNPISAFVGFQVFVRPAIEHLSGLKAASRPIVRVRLGEEVESDGRESYLRAVLREENGALVAYLSGHQGSANMAALVQANALLIIPAGVKSAPASREVDAWIL